MWYYIGGVVALIVVIFIVYKARKSSKIISNPLAKYINEEAEVVDTISDTLETGKILIDGLEVDARKGAPGIIDIGKKVMIKEVRDTYFIVRPL